MYAWDEYVKALHDLLLWLDRNGDKKISSSDIANTTIKTTGLSTGCCSAVWLTWMLRQQGTVVDWWTTPETVYTIETTGVPFVKIFNFDPVTILFPWYGVVSSNVGAYDEYRQNNPGHYGSFTPVTQGAPAANNVVYAPFNGVELSSNLPAFLNHRVLIDISNISYVDNIAPIPGYNSAWLYQQTPFQCNHMTVPWICRGEFKNRF